MLIELRRQVLYVMHNSQPQLRMREFLPRDDLRKHRPCQDVCTSVCHMLYSIVSQTSPRYAYASRGNNGNYTIAVFVYQTLWQYFDPPPLTGEWNAVDMKQEVKVI